MRILCLTNFYPPHNIGGMELSCQAVVEQLLSRGHAVRVLTSKHGVGRPCDDGRIARKLNLQMDLAPWRNAWVSLMRRPREEENLRVLNEIVTAFRPDVVFVCGMWNLDKRLVLEAETLMEGRVLYRLADYWPTLPSQRKDYWHATGRNPLTRLIRRLVAPLALAQLQDEGTALPEFRHGYCVSEAVRRRLVELGVPVDHMPIVHTGFDLSPYLGMDVKEKWAQPGIATRFLFAGRIVPEKGIETLLRGLGSLGQSMPRRELELRILGHADGEYLWELRRCAESAGVGEITRFAGRVSRSEVAEHMKSHGVMIVPSVWEDPLPRVAVEAMASGCLVVGSRIGGMSEIIEHGANGFLFPPGDHEALAQVLEAILNQREEIPRIAENARRRAERHFSLPAMMDRVEELLEEAADRMQEAATSQDKIETPDLLGAEKQEA